MCNYRRLRFALQSAVLWLRYVFFFPHCRPVKIYQWYFTGRWFSAKMRNHDRLRMQKPEQSRIKSMFCIHCNHISFCFARNNFKLQHIHIRSCNKSKFHQTKKSRFGIHESAVQFQFTTIVHIWLMELGKKTKYWYDWHELQ